jgi:hypothetical protein
MAHLNMIGQFAACRGEKAANDFFYGFSLDHKRGHILHIMIPYIDRCLSFIPGTFVHVRPIANFGNSWEYRDALPVVGTNKCTRYWPRNRMQPSWGACRAGRVHISTCQRYSKRQACRADTAPASGSLLQVQGFPSPAQPISAIRSISSTWVSQLVDF